LTLSIGCRTRCRSSRAPPIVGHGSASERAPLVAPRRTSNSATHPSWHRRRNRVLYNNSARPIASAIFCARSHCPRGWSPWWLVPLGWSRWVAPLGWVGLTCRMERCSEHANENGTNKRKGTEEEWKVNTKDYCRVLPGHLAGKVVRRGPDKSKSSFCRAVASLPRPRRHDGVFLMVHRPAF
jgi:hypothetical protein